MPSIRISRSVVLALGVAVALVAFLLAVFGRGVPSGESLIISTSIGLAVGALYAMTASGLVVVYTTTGVFNFAQGSIGVLGAFLYWEFHENSDPWLGFTLPSLVALLIVVLVIAPAIGVILDLLLMRRLRTASLVIQLMVTVGLMVFFLTLVGQIWDQSTARSVDHFFGPTSGFKIGNANILWHRFMVIVVAAVIAVLLRLMLFKTRLGIAMRAVVDNRGLADLNGARAGVVSSAAWAMGSSLAALAGILIAPEVELDPQNLNAIIFIALAAAAFGQLRSLPLTVLGALMIGVLERHTDLWLDPGSNFSFLNRAVAPAVLLLALLAIPHARLEVGRVSDNLKSYERHTKWWEGIIGALALFFGVLVLANGWLHLGVWDPGAWDSVGLNNAITALSVALVALSLVPLTGWAGQVSFAPFAFAGFGAVSFHWLSDGDGNMLWIPVVAVLTAILGAGVALPAARLRGLYLALMSIAFAQLMSSVVFPHGNVIGLGLQFAPLNIGGYSFSDRKSLLLLTAGVLGLGLFLLVVLRNSRYGRRWVALNDSQAASATIGIDVVQTKVVIYALSAAMAGVAGTFWASAQRGIDTRAVELFPAFEPVLLMAAAGMSMGAASLFLSFKPLFAALSARLDATGNVGWIVWFLDNVMVPFGPGLLAIGMVANQRGAMYEMGRGFAPLLPWRADARADAAAEKASKREPEIGGLGLTEPFTAQDVIAIDRVLGIQDDVLPLMGYAPIGADRD